MIDLVLRLRALHRLRFRAHVPTLGTITTADPVRETASV
jgi:hypothetical protein